MKEKIFAVILFVAIIAFVITNTFIINGQINRILDELYELNSDDINAINQANELYKDFKKSQKYISLTVSHEDLTNIEDCFVEMIGYLEIGSSDDAFVTKNRLIYSFEHLRRLSTFTLDSVI